jgi:hypothetical protein
MEVTTNEEGQKSICKYITAVIFFPQFSVLTIFIYYDMKIETGPVSKILYIMLTKTVDDVRTKYA